LPASHFIKIFGERNTGTRALIQMLRALPDVQLRPLGERGPSNLPEYAALRKQIRRSFDREWARIYEDGVRDLEHLATTPTKLWKHAAPVWDTEFARTNAHVIFCVRNPYSWLISLAKRPYHRRGPRSNTLLEFVERPWLTVQREYLPPLLSSPLELWNGKNRAYRRFAEAANVPTATLYFEDFVADAECELGRILTGFDIPSTALQALDISTKDNRNIDEIRTFYQSESWRKWLTADVVQAINDRIDWEVAAALGYAKLDPQEFPYRLSQSITAEITAKIAPEQRSTPKMLKSKSLSRSHNWMSRLGFQS